MGELKLKERPVNLQEEQVEEDQEQTDDHDKVNLAGSLASVTFLGLFILVSWLGVWTLFMIR